MSENVCPPIIQKHWMPELDYSRWAEVASKDAEQELETIRMRFDPTPATEPENYKKITGVVFAFNKADKSACITHDL